jgi:MYXO-CTERM domain-containing protein
MQTRRWLWLVLALCACDRSPSIGQRSAALQQTLYVDAKVSASGDGTSQAKAFKTIDECVKKASAGTTCMIAGGVYREAVGFNSSGQIGAPIVLKAMTGQTVVLSGAELITPGKNGLGSWVKLTLNGRTVYRIKLSAAWDLGAGKNQLFIDGKSAFEAHWPNVGDPYSLMRNDFAISTAGALGQSLGGGEYVGEYQHPGIKSHWGGGRMLFASGKDWSSDNAKVLSAQNGKLTFQFSPNHGLQNSTPAAKDPFLLIGKREAIDADGEWHFDAAGAHGDANSLYVALSAAPTTKQFEMRRRDQVLKVNTKNVTVEGLRLFGGGIWIGDAAANVTLDRLTVDYGRADLTQLYSAAISLNGSNNSVLRSTVRRHSGPGIMMSGADNRVEDNVVHGSITQATIQAVNDCKRCIIKHNTAFHAPGHGLVVSGLDDGEASYNRVYFAARWVTDVAGINGWGSGDMYGSVIHHNRVHHVQGYYDASTSHWGGYGIRLDSGGGAGNSNAIVHHNIVYETTRSAYSIWGLVSGQPNYGATKLQVYNNTGVGDFDLAVFDSSRSSAGTVAKNNLVLGGTDFKTIPAGAVVKSNLFSKVKHPGNLTGSPGFANSTAFDFSLLQSSAAVDAGEPISPYTKGFVGSAPDLGALERGAGRFVAGALIGTEHLGGLKATCTGTTCTVTGFPTGRYAPEGFVLRVDGKKSDSCRNELSMTSNQTTLTCTFGSSVAAPKEVAVSLDGTSFVVIYTKPGAGDGPASGDGPGPSGDGPGPSGDGPGPSGDGPAADSGASDSAGATDSASANEAGAKSLRGSDGCNCRTTRPSSAAGLSVPVLVLLLLLGCQRRRRG